MVTAVARHTSTGHQLVNRFQCHIATPMCVLGHYISCAVLSRTYKFFAELGSTQLTHQYLAMPNRAMPHS